MAIFVLSCVVPGPGASKICAGASSRARSCCTGKACLFATPHETVTNTSMFPESHSKGYSKLSSLCLIYVDASTCQVNLHKISSAVWVVNADTLVILKIDSFIFHRLRL